MKIDSTNATANSYNSFLNGNGAMLLIVGSAVALGLIYCLKDSQKKEIGNKIKNGWEGMRDAVGKGLNHIGDLVLARQDDQNPHDKVDLEDEKKPKVKVADEGKKVEQETVTGGDDSSASQSSKLEEAVQAANQSIKLGEKAQQLAKQAKESFGAKADKLEKEKVAKVQEFNRQIATENDKKARAAGIEKAAANLLKQVFNKSTETSTTEGKKHSRKNAQKKGIMKMRRRLRAR